LRRGVLAEKLSMTPAGLHNLCSALEPDHLELFLLERLHKVCGEAATLQVIAYAYTKCLATLGPVGDMEATLTWLWGARGPFTKMSEMSAISEQNERLGTDEDRSRLAEFSGAKGGWPRVEDWWIYGAKYHTEKSSVILSQRMQERLARETSKSAELRLRIEQTWKRLSPSGRTPGEIKQQLAELLPHEA
jgi:hypothetical protein